MKNISIIATIGLLQITSFWGCNKDETIPQGEEIPFEKIEHYFVRNSYQVDSSIIFLIIKDTATFDSVYHSAATNEPIDWLEPEDFKTNFVVTIIKQTSNDKYELNAERIYLVNDTLNIRYKSKLINKNLSYSLTCHLLLLIENCLYQRVIFYENGCIVKQLTE